MLKQKNFSTFSEQIEHLQKEKLLIISDKSYAEYYLKHIGYFPLLGGYKHLFRIPLTKRYKSGTSFNKYPITSLKIMVHHNPLTWISITIITANETV